MTLRTLLDRFELLMDTPESVPKLRRFILQLAVRGRLTERRSSDTPAEELLDPIRSEKKRLYDDGTIRKSQAKLPELAKNGESLPNGWISIELERAGVVNPRHDADEDTKASFVPMKRIEDGVGDGHTTEIRPWGEIRRGYTHFMEGDVGLAKITPCFQNRKSTVFRDLENGMGAGTTELYVFRPLAGTILPEFVLSFFQSQGFIEEGVSRMTGTAGQKRVPREYVEQSLLPLPPLEEQQRIVEAVDGLMDECDSLEEQQERERTLQVQVGTAATEALQSADDAEALLPAWERVHEHFDTVTATSEGVDALRKTILQLAVQGRLTERDPDDTPAGKLLKTLGNGVADEIDQSRLPSLPRNWQWTKLKDLLSNLRNGYSKAPRADSGTPVLRISAVRPLSVDLNDVRFLQTRPDDFEKYLAHPGDLLFIRYNGNEGLVGACAVMPSSVEAIGHPDKLIRGEIQRPDLTLPSYVAVAVNCGKSRHHIDDKSKTTAGNYGISQTDLRSTPIPVPPVEEQARIVDVVDQLLPLCDNLNMLLFETDEHGEQLLEAALRDTSVDRPDAVPAGATA